MLPILKRDFASDIEYWLNDIRKAFEEAANLELCFEPIGRAFPKVNISETDKEFVIEAALHGYGKDQIKLEVTNDKGRKFLTVKGEKSGKASKKDTRYLAQEVHFSSFHRSWALPADVDVDAIKTNMDSGVLTIELPKTSPSIDKKEITIS